MKTSLLFETISQEPIVQFTGIPITDWVSAVGVALGIIIVVKSLIEFKKDSRDKQTQLDNLVEMTKQNSLQTAELAKQTNYMMEANSIHTSHYELERRAKLMDQMPYFAVTPGPASSRHEVHHLLTNIGQGLAKIINIVEIPAILIEGKNHASNHPIKKDQKVSLNIKGSAGALGARDRVSYLIEFEDFEGNLYQQNFDGNLTTMRESTPRLKNARP